MAYTKNQASGKFEEETYEILENCEIDALSNMSFLKLAASGHHKLLKKPSVSLGKFNTQNNKIIIKSFTIMHTNWRKQFK